MLCVFAPFLSGRESSLLHKEIIMESPSCIKGAETPVQHFDLCLSQTLFHPQGVKFKSMTE